MRFFQRSKAPRLLVITNMLPGEHFAGELRLLRLCQLLVRRCAVDLVATAALPDDETTDARAAYLQAIGVVARSGSRTAVKEALSRHRYHGVLVEFWHVGRETLPFVRKWQPWARFVIDTVDLEFVRDERGVEFSHGRPPDVVSNRKQLELATYRDADALVFVSAEEQRIYRGLQDRPGQSWVIPILVALQTRTRRSRPPVVLFVGNFAHVPNIDGIAWFARDIWPQIRAAVPGATLRVVGAHAGDEITPLGGIEGVDVVGFVADLTAAYDDAAVVVAPLRWGAGMKGKVCEALAHAVPVVTTSVGAEGLRVDPGVDLIVTDEAPEMARAVIALLRDETTAEKMGTAGQAAVAALCLPDAVLPVVDHLVDFLTNAGTGRIPRSWWLRLAVGRLISKARGTATRLHPPAPLPRSP
jgi:O-antigen biosynthesis protein